MRLLLLQGLRHHRRNALQTLLTLAGIAAGVALLTAMRLGQGAAERAFDRAVAAVAGNATHIVTAGPEGIPVQAYAALRARLGGRGVAPAVAAIARVPERAGRTVLRVLGVDPFADAELRPWAAAGGATYPLAGLVSTPGGFAATPALLARLGVAPGETLRAAVGGRPWIATCVGALGLPPHLAGALDDVLLVDIATAQEWTGRHYVVDRLELILDEHRLPAGADEAAALDLVRELVGPAARVQPSGGRGQGLAQLAQAFRTNLTALSLLSLLVGAFLVHETMRLSVVARRSALGVLRALGVSGAALGAAVAVEALLLGIVGSAGGALLGIGGAQLLLTPIVRTLNDHYATFGEPPLWIDPRQVLLGAAAGVAVAVLAGLGPAVAAARVAPREVLVAAARGGVRAWRWWWCLPPAAMAWLLLATVERRLLQGYAGILALLFAAVLLVPSLLGGQLAAAAAALRRAGPFVRYAVRSTAAARDHVALPVAAMVLAVAATIGMAVLVGSFRGAVAGWLDRVLPGDVYVSVPGGIDEKHEPIDPGTVAALRAAPGVSAATVYQRTRLWLASPDHDGEIDVVGITPTPSFLAAFPLLDGARADARPALATGIGAWVSEPLAFRWGLVVGDRLTARTGRGAAELPVAAIYRDYSNERGELLVGGSWLDAQGSFPITALGIETAPEASATAVAEELRRRAAAIADQLIQIRPQRELRSSSLDVFDRTFAITSAMRVLCLVVAFFGIYSAFAALQLERGAEIGLLRCLGAAPRQIAVVVLGQTALLGAAAGLLAIPLGIALGHLLANVVNRISFGWSLGAVTVPPQALAEAAGFAVGAAVLAGVHPALRFQRVRPAAALREA